MKKYLYIFLLFPAIFLFGCRGDAPYHPKQMAVIVIILLILALFVALSIWTSLLREEITDCSEFDANAQKMGLKSRASIPKYGPYSLTRVQFGLWTVIISSSYVYLALCKGDCAVGPLNKTTLVLMGIFSSTAAAATIIDKQGIRQGQPRYQNRPSQGFFTDIFSDDTGISLHRFQNFVWTLIAITVYLYKLEQIQTGCILPELSDTLLALTGISNATYLVLRSTENNTPAGSVQATPNNTDT